MNTRVLALLAGSLTVSAVWGQQITPVWVEHINGLVNVLPENKLPTLVKQGGTGDNTYNFDGTDVIDSYANLLKYDDDHYLLGIRENGINENDPNLTAAQKATAAAYPDRSIIWIDAKTGKPMGIALQSAVHPVTLAASSQSPTDTWWKWGIQEGTNGQRAIYVAYKYKILRYAPAASVTDANFASGRPTWSTTPTEAWVEPVPDEPSPSVPPYVAKDPAQAALWPNSSGGDGSASWRWKAFRVTGSGNQTKIFAGGATWRASMNEQEFVTEDNGVTFYPIARLNDRGDGCGAKGYYSLGGEPSSIASTSEGLEWCIQGHFPGTGWTATPNRYVKAATGTNVCASDNPWWLCTSCSVGTASTNQPARPNYFDPVEGAVGSLPAFSWDAAGRNGKSIDHKVDGVQHYDGNWVMTADTADGVDYIVTYSIPSWNQQFGNVGDTNAIFKPGWIGLHTLDGKISTGDANGTNYAYKIPCYETDEPIVDPNGNGGTGHDYGYDGDVKVYPDANGKGGATVLWCGAIYGFGVFHVDNVAAAIAQQPQGAAKTEGDSLTLTAKVTGGANRYQWTKDGQPVPLGTSPTLSIDRLKLTDAGQYQLHVLNRLGNVDSTSVTVSVVPDTVPPTIASVAAGDNPTQTASWVTVTFSERVTAATASAAGNYKISGVTISAVSVVDEKTVMLKTSALTPGTEYTLTVSNIADQSPAANVIVANSQAKFTVALTPGFVLWEYYPGITGTAVDNLLSDATFPDSPAQRVFLTAFTTDPNYSNYADNFGARLSAWLTPTESGAYTFFISSDDASQLYFSQDANPANAIVIAEETACCNAFQEPGDSVTQTSAPQNLVAGKQYYIQALHKEGGGGDYVKVAWRKAGDTTAAAQLQPIPGSFLSVYRSAVPVEVGQFSKVAFASGQVTITWTGGGTLQESTDLKAWSAVTGNPSSPYQVAPSVGQKFYRLTQ